MSKSPTKAARGSQDSRSTLLSQSRRGLRRLGHLNDYLQVSVAVILVVTTLEASAAPQHSPFDHGEQDCPAAYSFYEANAELQDAERWLERNELSAALNVAERALTCFGVGLQALGSLEALRVTVELHLLVISIATMTDDIRLRERHLREALSAIQELFIDSSPEVQSWFREYANVLARQGKLREAVQTLEAALESQPAELDRLMAMLQIGEVYEAGKEFEQAREQYIQTAQLSQVLDNPRYEWTALHFAALAETALGNYEGAERLHVQVVRGVDAALAKKDQRLAAYDRELQLGSMRQIARIRMDQGRHEDAKGLLLRAVPNADTVFGSTMHPVPFSIRNSFAEATILGGNYEYGRGMIETHLSYARPGEEIDAAQVARAYSLLGFAISKSPRSTGQDLNDAKWLLEEALRIQETQSGPLSRDSIETRVFLASYYVKRGDLETANALLESVVAWSNPLPSSIGMLSVLGEAVTTLMALPGKTEEAYRLASRLLEEWQWRRKDLDLLARNFSYISRDKGREWIPGLVMDAAWEARLSAARTAGQTESTALSVLQEATIDPMTFAVAQALARRQVAHSDSEIGQKIKRREQLLEEYRSISANIRLRAGAEWFPWSSDEADAANARLYEIDLLLTDLDSAISTSAPTYANIVRPQKYDIDAIARELGQGDAIVVLFPSTTGTHVILLSHDAERVQWHKSSLDQEEVSRLVASIRRDVDLGVSNQDASHLGPELKFVGPFDETSAFQLYSELLKPFESHLRKKDRVIFVAMGPIASLPLALLVTETPLGGVSASISRHTKWLLDEPYASVYIPSLYSFMQLSAAAKQRRDSKQKQLTLFGVADPVLKRSVFDNSNFDLPVGADKPWRPDFEALPSLRRGQDLLKRIADHPNIRTDPSSLLVQYAATEKNFYDHPKLREADLLVFATHGLVADQLPGQSEPSLVFSPGHEASGESDDGLLTASEISALELTASLIVLAACNTAAGDKLDATSLAGLARAFFQAGAESVLASHWAVSENATVDLIAGALDYFLDGESQGRAVQLAMRDIKNSTDAAGSSSRAHPYKWAPFVLVGID